MTQYRTHLPQLGTRPLLTDGGLETSLIFQEGIELPFFAAFDLLKDRLGTERLARYYARYAEIAQTHGVGFVLETPTWRASADWGKLLDYDDTALADANRRAVSLMLELRELFEKPGRPHVISGNLGPRGDGYRADRRMSVEQARRYHSEQIETFADTDADLVTGVTINYVDEGVGMIQAAHDARMPVVLSFTVETDGRLPSGETLAEAITRTDDMTDGYAAYFMLNCAHPTHFARVLGENGPWKQRLRGLRANASTKSHAELDESTEIDIGNPEALGTEYRDLRALVPTFTVLGGCCGTDHRHVEHIARCCLLSGRSLEGPRAKEPRGKSVVS